MKMFVVLALAAVAFAEPEADPQVVVSGTPVSTVYNTPVTTYGAVSGLASPLLRSFTPYSTYNGLYNGVYNGLYNGVYGSNLVHSIGKRDADADPAVVYTSGLPVSTYGAVSHVAPVTGYSTINNVVSPYSVYSGLYNGFYNGVYGSSLVHNIGKRDAEADPAVMYTTGLPVSTYGAISHAVPMTSYSTLGHVAPVTSYSTVNPAVTYSAVNSLVKPVVSHVATPVSTYAAVPATHTITSYNNPNHYTAVTNGVFGPNYIAKNHGVQHVAKRSADPYFYSAYPATYAASHVVKGAYAPHAIAATPFGYTHSSNVGVCTNNMGVQVPC